MPYSGRERRIQYQRELRERRRIEGMEYLGGKCSRCGSTKELRFHHLRDKKFTIGASLTVAKERFLKEISKCILLCEECHRVEHAANHPHATHQRYWNGCRCEDCLEAIYCYNRINDAKSLRKIRSS